MIGILALEGVQNLQGELIHLEEMLKQERSRHPSSFLNIFSGTAVSQCSSRNSSDTLKIGLDKNFAKHKPAKGSGIELESPVIFFSFSSITHVHSL